MLPAIDAHAASRSMAAQPFAPGYSSRGHCLAHAAWGYKLVRTCDLRRTCQGRVRAGIFWCEENLKRTLKVQLSNRASLKDMEKANDIVIDLDVIEYISIV